MVQPLSDDEIAQLRREHVENERGECQEYGGRWPCEIGRLLAALAASEASQRALPQKIAELFVRGEGYCSWCGWASREHADNCLYREIVALLATAAPPTAADDEATS